MARKELTTAPTTAAAWLREIRDLLSGDLDSHIREVGSAEDYVERILGQAGHRRAREAFLDALIEHLTSWQPDRDDVDDYEIARTCELIAAFTPRVGFGKILGLLEHWRDTGALATPSAAALEARFQCLAALEMYYESAPVEAVEDPALYRYLKFLSHLLREPLFVSYALHRLLDLGVKEFVGPIVNDLDLLRLATHDAVSEWTARGVTEPLAAVCRACLMTGITATENLGAALESTGAEPDFDDHDLRISGGGRTFAFTVSDDWKIVYYAARVTIEQLRGLEFLNSLELEDAR